MNISSDAPTIEPTIDCSLLKMFKNETDKGSCILSSENNTYITVYTQKNLTFNEKYVRLDTYFGQNQNPPKPSDLSKENTIWIEVLYNKSSYKGFGKKLFKSVVDQAKNYGYKYVFLYPSANLSNEKVPNPKQDKLISIYETYGLIKLNPYECKDDQYNTSIYNIFDENNSGECAKYHLMFGDINKLTLDDDKYSEILVNYKKKYLKYKTKYLNLKNKFNKL